MIAKMAPTRIIPIHTEKPELFKSFKSYQAGTIIPEHGKTIKF